MPHDACHEPDAAFAGQSPAYRRVLWAVIVINASMFIVEIVAGIAARSQALQADALDFAGDSATYALSLFVLSRPPVWRANAALFKGVSLAAMGLFVFGSTVWRVFTYTVPEPLTMGVVGVLALAANLVSLLLLLRYREGDANVRSVWLCSRNDAIGNVAVVFAASGVFATAAAWPDLLVAAIMAGLFLASAFRIIRQAMAEKAALASP